MERATTVIATPDTDHATGGMRAAAIQCVNDRHARRKDIWLQRLLDIADWITGRPFLRALDESFLEPPPPLH
jgi:hypothetical protein